MDHVQALHADAYPDLFKPNMDSREVDRFFADILNKYRHRIFLSVNGEMAAGYIWFEIVHRQEDLARYPSQHGYIHQISVAPDVRWQGVGRQLVDAAKRALKAEGIERISVDYWAFNIPARRFFAKMGFTPQRCVAFSKL